MTAPTADLSGTAEELRPARAPRTGRDATVELQRVFVDLVDDVAIVAATNPAGYRRARRAEKVVSDWFLTRPGWPLLRTRDMVRLVKTPAVPESGQGFTWAKEPLDYACFLWVLWYGERLSTDRFLLSDLVREIATHVAETIGTNVLDLKLHRHRLSLQRAITALVAMRAVRWIDGEIAGFVSGGEDDVLYEFTDVAQYLRVSLDEVPLHAPTSDRNGLYLEGRATLEPTQRLYRGLLLSPAVYAIEDPEAFALLRDGEQREVIAYDLLSTFGWGLEVTQSYAAILRPAGEVHGQALFPTREALTHIVLLTCGAIRDAWHAEEVRREPGECVRLARPRLENMLSELSVRYGANWGMQYRELDPSELADQVETAMRAWGMLVGPDADGYYLVRPLAARYTGIYRADNQGLGTGELEHA